MVPPFINIGQRLEGVGEKEELKAFTTAGFFGSEFGPMNLPYPENAVRLSFRSLAQNHQMSRRLVFQRQ